MDDTPKEKREGDEAEQPEESTWEEDQKKREYYYDDAHGYEVYKDETDEDED